MSNISLADLRAANLARQDEWCPDQKPDLSFRGNELAGEVGEACNQIKKLERARHGWRGSKGSIDALGDELADVVICADLVAISAGIDLRSKVVGKFNATSEANGLSVFLETTGTVAQEVVAVKALEWNQDGSWAYGTGALTESYCTRPCLATNFLGKWLLVIGGINRIGDLYSSEDEAKAAAQIHYETRIRSALASPQASEPAPQVVGELTNEQKEITLLRIIDAMGGETDSSESKWLWLNWFCSDEIHNRHSDTFNRCHENGWLISSHDTSFDTSTTSLTLSGRAALASSQEKRG